MVYVEVILRRTMQYLYEERCITIGLWEDIFLCVWIMDNGKDEYM